MNLGKRLMAGALGLCLVFSLTACGGSNSQDTQSTTPATSETTTQSSGYPLTVTTYNYARQPVEETFEKAPERVWAQGQDNIEILLALGLADKIVGACGLDGAVRADLQDEFETINYYDTFPGKETVLGLQPDFITGWYSTFDDKRMGDVGFWHERGVNTYMALNSACRGSSTDAPQTIAEEMEDIMTLGKIFGVEDRAQQLVDEIQDELVKIQDYVKDKEPPRIAVLEDEGDSYRVYSHTTLGGNVAEQVGAVLAVGADDNTANISAEELISINPDAIFMVWYEGYTVGETDYAGDQVVELLTKDPKFASLSAVQNGKVFPINLSGIYCSGMRTLDGVLDFAQALYPDLYPDAK